MHLEHGFSTTDNSAKDLTISRSSKICSIHVHSRGQRKSADKHRKQELVSGNEDAIPLPSFLSLSIVYLHLGGALLLLSLALLRFLGTSRHRRFAAHIAAADLLSLSLLLLSFLARFSTRSSLRRGVLLPDHSSRSHRSHIDGSHRRLSLVDWQLRGNRRLHHARLRHVHRERSRDLLSRLHVLLRRVLGLKMVDFIWRRSLTGLAIDLAVTTSLVGMFSVGMGLGITSAVFTSEEGLSL